MYKSIRVIKSHRVDKINARGSIGFTKHNDGMVEALPKNGNTFRAPFGGFIEGNTVVGLKRVKLINVRYLCMDDRALKPVYQIPKDHHLVGVYVEGKFYVLLIDG